MAERPSDAIESIELRRLRRRIDAIDRELVALMNERAELAVEAGRAKARAGWPGIRDAAREAEVIEHISEANDGPLPDDDVVAIWRRLMRATRALEALDRERTDD
jgi:chorismate mutase/prephenate dehydratase